MTAKVEEKINEFCVKFRKYVKSFNKQPNVSDTWTDEELIIKQLDAVINQMESHEFRSLIEELFSIPPSS